LFLVALAICVLPSLVPAAWSAWRAPLPLRYPEKMAVGLVLAVSLLAGLAFDQLRRDKRARRWPLLLGVALALAPSASALPPRAGARRATATVAADPSLAPTAARHLPGALAEGGLLWMAAVLAIELLRRRGRLPVAAAALLVSIVPVAATRRIAQSFRQE